MSALISIPLIVLMLSIWPAPAFQPLPIDSFTKFDEWGDIRFSDEKARLDNAAITLKKSMPQSIIYLIVYAGRISCVGEAKARGMRAKKHLIGRGIPPAQVVWIDGGHRWQVTTEVWIWPPNVGTPFVGPSFDLEQSDLKLEKNCKIKQRRRSDRGNAARA